MPLPDDLVVRRVDACYHVPARENASTIQRRLDRIVRNHLGGAMESRVSARPPPDAIVFIEQMAVDIRLDVSNGEDKAVAETWARQTADRIEQAILRHEPGVTFFRNRADFLSSFLSDLMHGNAWQRWYYEEFEPLRSLPTGQIIIELLGADGDVGREVLLELTRQGDLDLLLATLTDRHAEAIMKKCLGPEGPQFWLPGRLRVWVEGVRQLLARYPFRFSASPARDAMRLYLTLLRERPELGPDFNLAQFLQDVLQVRATAWNVDVARGLASSEAIMATSPNRSAPRPAALLTKLRRELSESEVEGLFGELKGELDSSTGQAFTSQFGGLFLLSPAVLDLRLHELFATAPFTPPSGADQVKWLLSLLALECLGEANEVAARVDPGVALFAGCTGPVKILTDSHSACLPAILQFAGQVREQLATEFRRLGVFAPRMAAGKGLTADSPTTTMTDVLRSITEAVLGCFSARLGAFAGSSPEFLRRNLLESRAVIELSATHLDVRFLTCPLKTVLCVAGFDDRQWMLPWSAGRQLAFHFDN